MERTIDIENEFDRLNIWVQRSIEIFNGLDYLDQVGEVYDFGIGRPDRLEEDLRNQIITTHVNQNDEELIRLLRLVKKFPYDEPFWYLLKNQDGFINNNPNEVNRIASTLYNMTPEEVVVRLESPPKLNQTIGPKFNGWVNRRFETVNIEEFEDSNSGIIVLGETEEVGRNFVVEDLGQELEKRPDLIAKVNERYIIGEAKWIGTSGGNQGKSVTEVINFCRNQRGNVLRIGIVDGFIWMTHTNTGSVIKDKNCVRIQETNFNMMSTLLIDQFLESLRG